MPEQELTEWYAYMLQMWDEKMLSWIGREYRGM